MKNELVPLRGSQKSKPSGCASRFGTQVPEPGAVKSQKCFERGHSTDCKLVIYFCQSALVKRMPCRYVLTKASPLGSHSCFLSIDESRGKGSISRTQSKIQNPKSKIGWVIAFGQVLSNPTVLALAERGVSSLDARVSLC